MAGGQWRVTTAKTATGPLVTRHWPLATFRDIPISGVLSTATKPLFATPSFRRISWTSSSLSTTPGR